MKTHILIVIQTLRYLTYDIYPFMSFISRGPAKLGKSFNSAK